MTDARPAVHGSTPVPGSSPPAGIGSRRLRRWPLIAALVVVVLLIGGALAIAKRSGGNGGPTAAQRTAQATAQSSARAFLDSWVNRDGRVVRRDQGGDSVSEGQAYGMLLAVAAGDRTRFDQIWTWTRTHLQQPNSLLAWRWMNGAVTDDQSAADADLDAIWALSLAGVRFAEPAHTTAARTMAAAVLAQETVNTSAGRLLAAGPWARTSPATVNPSYLVAGTAAALARSTGDDGWTSLVAPTRALDTDLLRSHQLPPDWVTVAAPAAVDSTSPASPASKAGAVQLIGAPGGGAGVQYGLDAPRLLVRLAMSCDAADRRLAASASLAATPAQPALRTLAGQAKVSWQHPLTDVAAAAVQSAGNHPAAAMESLAAADALQHATPTYYGAAWVALGRTLLTTDLLTDCSRS